MAIDQQHWLSDDNPPAPAGGLTTGVGIQIEWQNGPLGDAANRQEPNGAFVEDVIEAALGRLRFYETSQFANAYNARAIQHLENALSELRCRTLNRTQRGVEGTYQL